MSEDTPRFNGITETIKALRARIEAAQAARKAAAEIGDVETVIKTASEISGIHSVIGTLNGEAVSAKLVDLEAAMAAHTAARQKMSPELSAKMDAATKAQAALEAVRSTKEEGLPATVASPAFVAGEIPPPVAKWADVARAYTVWAKAQDALEEIMAKVRVHSHAEEMLQLEITETEKALAFADRAAWNARKATTDRAARPRVTGVETLQRLDRWAPRQTAELEAD